MSKIKKFITGLVAILIVVAVILLFFMKKAPEGPAPAPSPNIPTQIKGAYPVEFLIEEKDFNFPQKATVDTKKSLPLSKDAVAGIADKLSLNEGPIIAQDVVDGEVNIYRSGIAALTAYVDIGSLRYTLNTLPSVVNKNLDEESIKLAATDFLLASGLVEESGVSFSSFLYLSTEGGEGLRKVSKEEAELIQVNFVPKDAKLPLLSLNPNAPPVYVRVLPDGSIFSANVQKFSIQKGISEYDLKTFSEVKAGSQGAILVSLDDGNIHLPDLAEGAVKGATFSSIELVALIDAKSELLIPVFLLGGEAEAVDYGKISAEAYLPALKGI